MTAQAAEAIGINRRFSVIQHKAKRSDLTRRHERTRHGPEEEPAAVNIAVELIAATIIASAAAQMCTDPRISRRFAQRRKIMIAVFALYGALGLADLAAFVPHGQVAAFGAFAALFGWIGLAVLASLRISPGPDTPAKVLRVGGPDIACLVAIAAGLAQALLLT